MARVLISGARAPIALELVRNLARHEHSVFTADSLRYPLAKKSRFNTEHFTVAPAKQQFLQ